MNNKILISSIIAVAILVLVSFTGVVGYQTTKSSTIARASPLFTVRSSRAIDEESKDIACDYVGKGEESVLSIPKRDEKKVLLQKFINRIRKMNDEELDNLIKFGTTHMHNFGIVNSEDSHINYNYSGEFTYDNILLCNIFYIIWDVVVALFLILLSPILIPCIIILGTLIYMALLYSVDNDCLDDLRTLDEVCTVFPPLCKTSHCI
ncbi:hypothetical protein MBGDF03_00798 [Thermoplasmatales archaeon SCGC AB-540-F20]|nr:hypothetical protein MBGDF03_00798 [Thermoplasmatales archaeon SCGC AB-540-F20]